MSDMFHGPEESENEDVVKGYSKLFEKSEQHDIDGGVFSTEKKGRGSEENDREGMSTPPSRYQLTPAFSGDGPEMFKELEGSILNEGISAARYSSQMFENPRNIVITGGEYFDAGSANTLQGKNAPKTSQQGVYPRPTYSTPTSHPR